MPIIVQTARSIVTGLWGTSAVVRGADGKLRALKVGDLVLRGDQIITSQDGIVQLHPEDSPTARAALRGGADVDRTIAELERNDPRAAPAAGAGGEATLEEGYRVGRIVETLSPLGLPALAGAAETDTFVNVTGPAPELQGAGFSVKSTAISAVEQGPNVGLGIAPLRGLVPGATITVDQVPAIGSIVTADGTVVRVGATLSPPDLAGLRYVPPADYDAAVPAGSFVYTVTSGADVGVGTVLIALSAFNDVPLATAGSTSGGEDAAIPIALGGTDVDGTIAAVTVTSLPAGATLLLADGITPVVVGQALTPAQAATLILIPPADFAGTATVGFTVTDNGGAVSAPAAMAVAITPVNDRPVATVAPAGSGAEDTPIAVQLAGTDIDGSVVAVTVISLPANGTLTLANGVTPVLAGVALTPAQAASLVFTPAADFNGTVQIGFTVTDNDGAVSAPARVPVTVQPANDAPTALADAASTAEDTPVSGNVLANDSDADGNALAVTQFVFGGVPHPAGASALVAGVGTLTVAANGSYTFTPALDFNGAVPPVDVSVSDGTTTIVSTLSISVTPVNDVPVAVADLAATPINTATTISPLANDRDPDGDVLTVTTATMANPAQGSVTINADGTLAFTPAVNFTGAARIDYTISDPSGATSAASVIVTVGANTPPTGTDAARVIAEDGSYTFAAADFGFADADALQSFANLRIDTLPAAGTLTLGGIAVAPGQVIAAAQIANLVFTPAPDASGAPYTSFSFSVQDSGGAFDTVPNTFAFNVTPVNDAPLATPDTVAAVEDTPVTFDPRGNDTDADGNPLTITAVAGVPIALGAPVTLPQGTVALNADGTLTFTPAANFNGPAVFAYTVSDGTLSSTAQITVNVAPVNDAPLAGNDLATTPINTPLLSIPVLANDSDVDGNPLTVTSATLANPALGSVAINADGTLRFTPASNVSGAVVVNYTIADGQGGTAAATLTVTVGANTAPTGADATYTIAEDGSRAFSAADFGFADADAGQSLANVRIDTLPGAGTLTLGGVAVVAGQVIPVAQLATLVYTPVANANGTAYAAFTFSVQDSAGAYDTAPNTITINVTPVADAALIGGNASGATVEDVTTSASGVLTVTDPDAGEAAFTPQTGVAGAYGTFAVNAAGAWTYTLNNALPAVQALGAGQTLPAEAFTVTTIDGTTAIVTVTITGTNDGAAIVAGTGGVTEDIVLGASGTLVITDVDTGQATFTAQPSTTTAYGTFTLAANGAWTYTLNNALPAVQALGAGQTLTETIPVQSVDGTASTVTITINGNNDAAVISAGSGTVTEDTVLATGGTLTITDIDSPATFVAQPATAGAYGTFTLAADGTWSFALNNALPAVQGLGAGQTLAETFTVASADGTPSSVTVTIVGTNDAPVISSGTGAVTENTTPSVAGTLSASDADNPALAFNAGTIGGTYGSLVLAANGAWTYTLDARAEPLAQGQVVGDVITVTLNDGSTTTVTITITGTNDAAVIGGVATGNVTEDGVANTGGTLTISDIDSPASFVAAAVTGTYGDFAVAANGAWTYTLRNGDANVQALTSAMQPIESFTVTAADGTTTTVTVTVNGANEVPTALVTPASGNEDTAIPVTLGGSDADGTVASFTIGTLPANGTLLFGGVAVTAGQVIPAAAGSASLSFVPNANWNGATSFNFTATDNEGAVSPSVNVPITVAAVADAAVIGGNAGGATVEDVTTSANGVLTVADPDAGEAAFTPQTGAAGAYGTFAINAAGAWTYTLNNTLPAVQALGAGQTLPAETFTVATIDGTTAVVTVSITGTNDGPVAQGAAFTVNEDAPVVNGSVVATDVDANATLSFALNGAAPAGLTFNADGTYTFNAGAAAYQSLAAGQTQVITVPYTVTDDQGATSTANLVITVVGTNDAAVIGGVATGSVTEDGVAVANGNLTITDADGPASFTPASATGTYGTFTIAANGVWTYTLNNAAANVQALTSAMAPLESFTVTAADGTTTTVTITVNGANEAPTAIVTPASGNEDNAVPVTIGGSDADGTIASFTIVTLPANGTLLFGGIAVAIGQVIPATAGSASLSFVPNPNWNGATAFDFTATDNEGAVSTAVTVPITLAAVNDAPVANADVATTAINTPILIIPVLANDTDADGNPLTVTGATLANPALGTVAVNADGTLRFTPAANVTGPVLVNYTISDGNGGTATGALTVNIGANTPPAGADAAATIAEDTTRAFTAADFGFSDADAGQTFANVRIDTLPSRPAR